MECVDCKLQIWTNVPTRISAFQDAVLTPTAATTVSPSTPLVNVTLYSLFLLLFIFKGLIFYTTSAVAITNYILLHINYQEI